MAKREQAVGGRYSQWWQVMVVGVHSKEAAAADAAVVAISGCYGFSPISACCDVVRSRRYKGECR